MSTGNPERVATRNSFRVATNFKKSFVTLGFKAAIEKGKGFGYFHHAAYQIACAYALMNKPEQAVKWLETAASDGFPCYPLFETETDLNKLRQDARFLELMAKLKRQWDDYKSILYT